ncbi:phage protein D [Bradyrhizobium liaoningense]|uniref:phage late control D family protein n=1 Tax=Bradyrhizobium TaxID=374 RepID=UPI00040E92AA|nr:contractile injection system protein, VgrG/Pvc8 family [Bradyrhizobium japonicum]WLB87980.1 contractile injection system protein, VgrG/Pvc8 family [Bradyrhizobium japonicum USDA 135]
MTPAARILLDGRDITANLIPAPFGLPLEGGGHVIPGGVLGGGPLLSLTVQDNEGKKSDSCELEIDNREHIPAPGKGSKLQVSLGFVETGVNYMGTFLIDSWTKKGRPKIMTVTAKAAGLTTEIKSPKSRSYHEKSVDDIVQYIAGRNGLSAIVNGEVGGIKIDHIDQSSESDLNFLTRLAGRVGANFKLADEKVIFNKAGSGMLPSGGAAPVFMLTEIGVTDWDCTGSTRGDYKSVEAAWHNIKKGEREWVKEGGGNPVFRSRKLFKTKEEAEAQAKATKGALARGKKVFAANFLGRTEMFAGAGLTAIGFDPDCDGSYTIKSATHRLNDQGLTTRISCETAGEGSDDFWGGGGGG